MPEFLKNITDKDTLQDNLTFVSLYIAVYEHMADYVVSNIKFFLCEVGIKDGKEFFRETDAYKTKIRHRIVDEKGNKDKTKASFLWLVDNGGISQLDYEKFLEIKDLRNQLVHELTSAIYRGLSAKDVEIFFDMYALYRKISRFMFSIEASIMGVELPDNFDLDGVKTTTDIMFGTILNVLYNGKSEEYKALLAQQEK